MNRAADVGQMEGYGAEEVDARREVLETALSLSRRGLSPGRSGNVSRRFGEGMIITPSGLAYETLRPEDMVYVSAGGERRKGEWKPSSEWRFHLAVYTARPDVAAVVHSHSLNATALACAHKEIPAFHYMVAVAGGKNIPLVPYATFGTDALSRHVVKGLRKRNACLMANHGQIAVAASCVAALELAAEVELLAEQYCKVLAIGKPKVLDDDEMERVIELFEGYGQKAQD